MICQVNPPVLSGLPVLTRYTYPISEKQSLLNKTNYTAASAIGGEMNNNKTFFGIKT
jgi:hypothetical protein